MKIELTETEVKTLDFYLQRALIDAKGLLAIGVGNRNTVNDLESIKTKITGGKLERMPEISKSKRALMDDGVFWNNLKKHIGHNVEIICYGDKDNPANISLECNDCDEVILDVELYTIRVRKDV